MNFENVLDALKKISAMNKIEPTPNLRIRLMEIKNKKIKKNNKPEIVDLIRDFKQRNLNLSDDCITLFEKLILINEVNLCKRIHTLPVNNIFELMDVYDDNASLNGGRSTFIVSAK